MEKTLCKIFKRAKSWRRSFGNRRLMTIKQYRKDKKMKKGRKGRQDKKIETFETQNEMQLRKVITEITNTNAHEYPPFLFYYNETLNVLCAFMYNNNPNKIKVFVLEIKQTKYAVVITKVLKVITDVDISDYKIKNIVKRKFKHFSFIPHVRLEKSDNFDDSVEYHSSEIFCYVPQNRDYCDVRVPRRIHNFIKMTRITRDMIKNKKVLTDNQIDTVDLISKGFIETLNLLCLIGFIDAKDCMSGTLMSGNNFEDACRGAIKKYVKCITEKNNIEELINASKRSNNNDSKYSFRSPFVEIIETLAELGDLHRHPEKEPIKFKPQKLENVFVTLLYVSCSKNHTMETRWN